MKKLLAAIIFLALPLAAQTTITTSTTVLESKYIRPGINFNHIVDYGMSLKSRYFNMSNNGYTPKPYYNEIMACTTGGTQTTTNFYSSYSGTHAYPAHFFQNYKFEVLHYDPAFGGSASSLGTGTISDSTDNTASGINLTLGTPISAACSPGTSTSEDQIYLYAPSNPSPSALNFSEYYGGHVTGTGTFEDTDLMSGYAMAVEVTNGSIAFGIDNGVTQTQNTVSTAGQVYHTFNGTYDFIMGLKNVSGCSVSWSVGRSGGGTTFDSGTFTPTSTWSAFTHASTPNESAGSYNTAQINLSFTGDCKMQYVDYVERSTDAANTTILTDDVFHVLKNGHFGSLRFMDTADWCADANHLTQTSFGLAGVCGDSPYNRTAVQTNLPYAERLKICAAVGVTDCWISGGNVAQASDYALIPPFLSSGGWNAMGFNIHTEFGNEQWNNTPVANYVGNGIVAGYQAGPIAAAFKAASGYNSAVDKLVFGGRSGSTQSYGTSGWTRNVLTTSGCTLVSRTNCPDSVDVAYYTLNNLNDLTDPYNDEVAENTNIGTKTGYPATGNSSFDSAKQTNIYTLANWNVPLSEYEYQYSPINGTTAPTQLQINQITSSNGNGLVEYEHALLLAQQAGVTMPINEFGFADEPCNTAVNSTCHTAWSAMRLMPGSGGVDVYAPVGIYETIGNTAIASVGQNACLMSVGTTGVATFNYAGGQGGTIDANPAVPYLTVYDVADCATKSKWARLIFNKSETTAYPVSLNYASGTAPGGNVSFIRAGDINALTDNNSNTNLSNNGTAAPMVLPTTHATLASNTADTLPAHSLTAYTWTTSGTSPAATPTFSPVAGTYGSAQTVTISTSSSGAILCYTTNGATPATNGTTGCTTGTLYSSPVSVASSLTLKAVAGGTGFSDSTVGSAAYVISSPTPGSTVSGGVTMSGVTVQ